MKRRIKEITPNIHNEKLFVESLKPESIDVLALDIETNGLHYPVIITKVGAVLVDGERRWRACKKLGWDFIEVIEEDIHRNDIFERVVASVANQRQMTLIEQARVYFTYYNHLKRARKKGDLNHIEAKKIAMQKAHLPFRSVTLADQLVHVVNRGDADLHEKLLRGDLSVTGAYERILRRQYEKPEKPTPLPKPPPTPEQLVKERARRLEKLEKQEEEDFTRRYVEAHQDELQSAESKQKLLALFEPERAPAAKKFRPNEETQRIAEAFEALAIKEEPEKLVGRLTAFIENIVVSIKAVDEQRARDIVLEVVKPMILRLAHQFPREDFEVPHETK